MLQNELKKDYNRLLARYEKLCEWDKTASPSERIKYSKNSVDLMREISSTWNLIKDKNNNNMFGGFKI